MKTILVTGSGGLIGRETSEFFLKQGYFVIGIDNNMRKHFFGIDGDVNSNILELQKNKNYKHHNFDIQLIDELNKLFLSYSKDIDLIIHTAAQPSHDWAVKDPLLDFNVNATATLYLLEMYRTFCPTATFIFMSTNKVYGDNPNLLPLIEINSRWELPESNEHWNGIKENFSIDNTKHSLFGCSKVSADVYVQEYGKYFGLKTTTFRGGCLTGSKHKGAKLHGFLNYLVKCNMTKTKYIINGYKGKQVRDNIHSSDLVSAFYEVSKNPRIGEVYNIGGGRFSNCSILEAIEVIESLTNIKTIVEYNETNRIGDHMWWISNTDKFKNHYPEWKQQYGLVDIIREIISNIEL